MRPSPLPGLLVTLALALAALYVQHLPFAPFTVGGRHPVDAILLAIAFGIALRNTVSLPAWLGPGIKTSVARLLPLAIVLMGAKLDFVHVMRVSGQALLVNVTCVVLALTLTVWLCRRTGVGQKLGLLIGIGTAICGGTAIAVAAPVIEASDEDTAFAITTITIFGLLSILVFPAVGTALGLGQYEFGVWAGTAIHATPQVMAAGFAYGVEAGEVAVIVKLVRVLMLAPLVIGLGLWYARVKRRQNQAHVTSRPGWQTLFPPFILGFVAMAMASSLHLLPDFTVHLHDTHLWNAGSHEVSMATLATSVSSLLVTIAMAGVGLGVNLRGLRQVGLKALYVGLFSAVVLAVAALLLARTLA